MPRQLLLHTIYCMYDDDGGDDRLYYDDYGYDLYGGSIVGVTHCKAQYAKHKSCSSYNIHIHILTSQYRMPRWA